MLLYSCLCHIRDTQIICKNFSVNIYSNRMSKPLEFNSCVKRYKINVGLFGPQIRICDL